MARQNLGRFPVNDVSRDIFVFTSGLETTLFCDSGFSMGRATPVRVRKRAMSAAGTKTRDHKSVGPARRRGDKVGSRHRHCKLEIQGSLIFIIHLSDKTFAMGFQQSEGKANTRRGGAHQHPSLVSPKRGAHPAAPRHQLEGMGADVLARGRHANDH